MSRAFNLIDEKWIPVRLPDGSRDELGIRTTLLQAKDITAIEDPSPLVVASLHRFLLALLYRALEGPTDIEQAKILFRTGLPTEKIEAYLEKWRDRFWLFDDKYPFAQNKNTPTARESGKSTKASWVKLTAENNPTLNKTLFDHTTLINAEERTPKECARWLLATMNFSISGGTGYYPSPSSNAIMCIPLGANLFQTLCFNLVPYPNKEVMIQDSAIWEKEPCRIPPVKPKRVSTGYADLFTWPSRRILLEKNQNLHVPSILFIEGDGFDNPTSISDPMQAYKTDKKYGRLPIQFREDRGTWRDFDSLLPGENDNAPLTIQNVLSLTERKPQLMPKSFLALGLRYEPPNANLSFWRMERFVLPESLAGDKHVRFDIRKYLEEAEDAQKQLFSSCNCFARNIISRGARIPDSKDIRNVVSQMSCLNLYWSILEANFHKALQAYTLDKNPDEIKFDWLISIKTALIEAWSQHKASVSTSDVWAIRALVLAEYPINKKIKELDDKTAELKTSLQKEGA